MAITGLLILIAWLLFFLPILGGMIYLFVLAIKALRKYLAAGPIRKEKNEVIRTLGECLKEHRTRCKMTQEFVAEAIGVTRQAVSKWENGTTDPSTSNLLALSKLYDISAEELLHSVEVKK